MWLASGVQKKQPELEPAATAREKDNKKQNSKNQTKTENSKQNNNKKPIVQWWQEWRIKR